MNKDLKPKHIPVMLEQVIDSVNLKDKMTIVDATLGGGGHTKELIARAINKGYELKLILMDQDVDSIKTFRNYLEQQGYISQDEFLLKNDIKISIHQRNFKDLAEVLKALKISSVDAIIADLGFSTDQLEDSSRGFSFLREGDLDMRMDPKRNAVKASDLLNVLDKTQLTNLFKKFGDLTWEAKKIASEIVNYRKIKRIEKVSDLLKIIKKALNFKNSRHVEARVFQAIRIQVNQEIDALESFLPQSLEALVPHGVVSILTFHSGEDRVVKKYFKELESKGLGEAIRIKPGDKEIKRNPKSSSAKLRIFKKNV